MSLMRLSILVLALSSVPIGGWPAEASGRLYGTVIDETNAMTLPTAPVEIVGTDVLVRTDLDGRYSIELPPGLYDVKFTFAGYRDRTATSIQVVEGRGTELTVSMVPESIGFSEEVVVTAELEPVSSSDAAQLVLRKKAGAVSDNMGADEMSANDDGNAADAMKRVTGLSVVDNSYVFVRGLGERYSNTTLGGAVMPTTEPDKRVVPLDLFQTGLIDNIQVLKTYTPDKPADFAGGLVEIEPLSFPHQRTLELNAKLGTNSLSTFENGLSYAGGGRDWLTFDDGTRALPGAIPADEKVVRGSRFTDAGFTPAELQTFGRAFRNTWQPTGKDGSPDGSFGLTFGDSWERVGLVTSVNWSRRTRSRTEEQTFYKVSGGEIAVQNDYDFQQSTRHYSFGLVGNLALRVSPTTQITLANFWTRNSKDETRYFEGNNADVRTDIRDTRLFWAEEGVYSGKLSGEHYADGLHSRLDWSVIYSKARRDEPDLRETLYEFDPFLGKYVLADESQSGLRMYNDLDDRVWQFGVDYSFYFNQWSQLPAVLKAGPMLLKRDRDFSSRRFRLIPNDLAGVDLSQPPEVLFASENIGSHFELNEETRTTDTYTASQDVEAGYLMLDMPLSAKWRFVGGARLEQSKQTVRTFDLFAIDRSKTIDSTLDNTDILPGLNVIWAATPSMNLRAAYSHTVNRPEFRELAPFEFTDVVGGRAVVGNTKLQRALIRNFDLRWEWFPAAREVVAVSLFYKDFDNPIERVVQPTAQLRTSYTNALGAKNKGVELELRRSLTDDLFVAANYSYVDSEIDLAAAVGQVQTSLVRPLAGQSKHLINAFAEMRFGSFSGRVLYNYFGDRIVDVGSLGLPDILEEGRHGVDVVVSRHFANGLNLKLSGENLLDADYEYTVGGFTQRIYKIGRTFSVSLGYSAF